VLLAEELVAAGAVEADEELEEAETGVEVAGAGSAGVLGALPEVAAGGVGAVSAGGWAVSAAGEA
jgi:hypothetical protein